MARTFGTALTLGLVVTFAAPAAMAQEEAPASAPLPAVAVAERPANVAVYGAALRTRWISVPTWFLGLFLEAKVPLSSYGVGAEFFRRKRDKDDEDAFFDITLGLGYQKMGPPDGNWLGKNKDPAIDTDLVQFRAFGLLALDASYVRRQYLSPYFGIHYGAGLGLAIVTGKILRTSAAGCTKANVSDTRACKPIICPATGCTEAILKASEGQPDNGAGDPHRFAEDDVPGAIPILNLVMGLNFRLPDVRGLDMRLEAGWYDAFFVGLGVGYLF